MPIRQYLDMPMRWNLDLLGFTLFVLAMLVALVLAALEAGYGRMPILVRRDGQTFDLRDCLVIGAAVLVLYVLPVVLIVQIGWTITRGR